MAFLLSTTVLLLGVPGSDSLWTVSKTTAQSGGSVTIPCHYHWLYKDSPKFWYKGKSWLTSSKLRPTSQEKRPAISFLNSPDELVTSMTMTNLQRSDSNRYWCAVKAQGSYLRTSLDLTVTEGTPDLSAASNAVSGQEGGNVTVRCLYSDRFKDTERKWCRSGDLHSCQTAQDIEPSAGAALQINDTDDGVFTVTLTGLKKTDAGWYWCMAGEMQVPVHINVHSRQLSTDANTIATLVPASSRASSASTQTETTDQTSTVSPKQFHPATTQRSPSCSTFSSALTSRSTAPHTVTLSSKDVTFEPKITYESRDLIWLAALVCGALLVLMLPVVSWKLWSWHKKVITGVEATEITTDLHTNDSADLLDNEWTNASVVQFTTDANTVLIT
ncbi:polymeric immunoglobulin receptor isoform X2 [Puntigrus tetrazona]|uniref:polymeric immunoglobulin receptor isoform X2 n=1 Tax=Puntigrus tetrazona TaxID=1606681 RepID=UPI001C897D15|nr:polymeric immunoglobulin receptor isoform X2 [Puntigrus tetrazona]